MRNSYFKVMVVRGKLFVIAGICFAIVFFASWRLWAQRDSQSTNAIASSQASATADAGVRIETIRPEAIPQWIAVTGTVRAELEATLSTKVSGRINKVLVQEGDLVHRGQTLINLDARDFDAAVNQSEANLRVFDISRGTAEVTAKMEASLSVARIAEAKAKIAQSEATLSAARARLELVQAGPRKQERSQAALAVLQAKSQLTLSEANLRRMDGLVNAGAISKQQFDAFKSAFEVARAQYQTALEAQSLADEGSRKEDIHAADQAVKQSEAELLQAKAGLRQAEAAALQADVRRQEVHGAEAQVAQTRAALSVARVTRDYATVEAPFDGVVTRRMVDPGAVAGPGVPLLRVQGGKLRLEALVPESVLRKVRRKMRIPLKLDALSGGEVIGVVSEVMPQGDAASHTFTVKIDLSTSSGARAGMFGRARIQTGEAVRLRVPVGCISEKEGLQYLFVVDDKGIARLRLITVGEEEGGRATILSGLNAGERVITAGRELLVDGAAVGSPRR